MVRNVAGFERHFMLFPKVVVTAAREEMENQAEALVAELKRVAPVYAGPETMRRGKNPSPIIKGALRDSIGWTWGKTPEGSITIAESKARSDHQKIRIYAGGKGNGQDAFYAAWVEHGTSKWVGNPFFFFTYRARKRKMKSAITRKITGAIKSHYGVPKMPRKPRGS